MAERCRVPGCKDERQDDRGYCKEHHWLLSPSEWTEEERLDDLREHLESGFSALVPLVFATRRGDSSLPPSWLQERVDPREARAILEELYNPNAIGWDPKSKEIVVAHVERLLALIRDGAELHWFSSPGEGWQELCGRAGWAIARDGAVLWKTVTMMN